MFPERYLELFQERTGGKVFTECVSQKLKPVIYSSNFPSSMAGLWIVGAGLDVASSVCI